MKTKRQKISHVLGKYVPYVNRSKNSHHIIYSDKEKNQGLYSDDGIHRAMVSQTELDMLWNLFKTNPYIQRCYDIFSKYIFSEGLELHIEGLPIAITSATESHINNHWIKFGKDLLAWFICTGAAPVAIRNISGEPTPVVLQPSTGTFQSAYTKSTQYLSWINSCGSEEDESSVIVFTDNDLSIDVHGRISSIVSSLVRSSLEYNYISKMYMEGLRKIINPLMVFERTEQSYTVLNKEPNAGFYADHPDRRIEFPRADKNDDDYLCRQIAREMADDDLDGFNGDFFGDDVPRVGYDPFMNSFRVPSYFKSVPFKQDQPNINISQVKRDHADDVYARFDIPRTMLGLKDTSYTNRTTALDSENTFIHNIKNWKSKLALIMTTMWRCIYDQDGCKFTTGKWNPSLGRHVCEDQLLANVCGIDNPYMIVFPPSPFTSTGESFELFDREVISKDELVSTTRKNKGFPYVRRTMAFLVNTNGDNNVEIGSNTTNIADASDTTSTGEKDSTTSTDA